VIAYLKESVPASQIVALVRTPEKAADLGVEVRALDYTQPDRIEAALEGIDRLLLISSNEIGQRTAHHGNVIRGAEAAGVKLIVYTSLLHADTSTLVLAGEHAATEELLKGSAVPYVVLRNGWYTENYTDAIAGVLAHGAVFGSAGEGKISAATRDDFAKAAVKVLTTEGHEYRIYELAGDEAFTLADYAAEIARQTGKPVTYQNLPVSDYTKVLEQAGLPAGIAEFLAGTHVDTEKGALFDDSRELSRLTGEPTTSLAKAVADAFAGVK